MHNIVKKDGSGNLKKKKTPFSHFFCWSYIMMKSGRINVSCANDLLADLILYFRTVE